MGHREREGKVGGEPVEDVQQCHGVGPSGKGHEDVVALVAHGVACKGGADFFDERCLWMWGHEAKDL
ncbi:hypothetical protein DSLASN_46150 [Desulfoluna limicola]|uniref:Uncharacterized protein n=1 Tax=Desulfoluna limicola TaxID=2810562 RepID=A0ABM7PN79_9BACT|nr:hypothetical protein DSLASN_46150 [Desulfoluna limicola]